MHGDPIRGDGLFHAHKALLVLKDPERLERVRGRFDRLPPPYTSDRSETTTRTGSPDFSAEVEQTRLREQVSMEYNASRCREQFIRQMSDEHNRILKVVQDRTESIPLGIAFTDLTYERIKKQWTEQGIWNDKWTEFTVGKWKHEEPLGLVSESETSTDALSTFTPALSSVRKRPRRKESEEERRQKIKIRERDREASRPHHQFVYQISKERERIQEGSTNEEVYMVDINTKAYNNVQALWRKRKIWNEKCGIMPGMSWKHEQPWEEVLAEAGLQLTLADRRYMALSSASNPPSKVTLHSTFDLSSFDLSSFDLSSFDLSSFDLSSFDLPTSDRVQVDKSTTFMPNAARYASDAPNGNYLPINILEYPITFVSQSDAALTGPSAASQEPSIVNDVTREADTTRSDASKTCHADRNAINSIASQRPQTTIACVTEQPRTLRTRSIPNRERS